MLPRPKHSAFTLLELVLVMVIVGTVLAMAAPSLSGWSRGSRLRDAADEFVAVAHRARSMAVTDAVVCRVKVDEAAGTYQLLAQQGDAFEPVAASVGRTFSVPSGTRLRVSGATDGAIDFYPNGRSTVATLELTDDRGGTVQITCPSPAEGFIVSPQNAGGR